MPESALAARLKALEDWRHEWREEWRETHEPRLREAREFKVWLLGLSAGFGALGTLIGLGLLKVALNV